MLVGLIFLGLAVAGATVSFTQWKQYQEPASLGSQAIAQANVWLARFWLYGGGCFTVLLILCGLYSLVKARSVR